MAFPTVPTKRVKLKGSTTEAVINVSDFDPSLHEELKTAPAPRPKLGDAKKEKEDDKE